MSYLSNHEQKFYHDNGYIAPIDIFTAEEALSLRNEYENLEKIYPKSMNGKNRNNVHYVTKLFDRIVHNPKILDAVESIIGPNILVGGSTLFVKDPEKKGFISWHQDARYIGLEPYNWVTAWLALSNVTPDNGCMYMWPGSHLDGQRDHIDTFDKDNLLTRGQTVTSIKEDETVPITLQPGQLSLHHPWVVHGSGHNISKERRIGFAIQSYIGANVDSILGKIFVQQARGLDTHQYHEHKCRPISDMHPQNLTDRDEANTALQEIFYSGARQKGNY